MTFKSASEHPASPANHVGIAIKVIDPDTFALHVGLVYRLSDGTHRMAHLAFHEDLRDDIAPTGRGFAWADCGWLQDPDHSGSAAYVANFIQQTVRRKTVPYGLIPDLDCYSTGQYVETDPRYGLTCASYVAAVLKGAGFDVVDIATWIPRSGDDAWSEHVLALLRELRPPRAAELAGQQAPFRLRPDEVAAAAAGAAIPIGMQEAEKGAAEVRGFLQAMHG